MASPCHIPAHPTALRPNEQAGLDLQREIAVAVTDWEKWWKANVYGRRDPPAPPKDLASGFVDVASVLFDTPKSEIGVTSKRGETISDRLSIDLYETDIRGQGGSSREDIDARIKDAKAGQMSVILQLQVDAFEGRDSILGMVGTGIHEAAHYRHYAMTRHLIRQWQTSSRANKSRKVTDQVLRTDFGKFIDNEVKAKRLSQSGRLLVYSTFGVRQATHPLAQIHAFMGVYPLYPRERDGKGSKGGLYGQARFSQLEKGAVAWGKADHPLMNTLPIEVIVAFAKDQGACVVTDLREHAAEIAAKPTFNKGAAGFYAKLDAALAKP